MAEHPHDLTVALELDHHAYTARLLNSGEVQVYLDDALAGTAIWQDGALTDRADSLSDRVYNVVEALFKAQLGDELPDELRGD